MVPTYPELVAAHVESGALREGLEVLRGAGEAAVSRIQVLYVGLAAPEVSGAPEEVMLQLGRESPQIRCGIRTSHALEIDHRKVVASSEKKLGRRRVAVDQHRPLRSQQAGSLPPAPDRNDRSSRACVD